MRGVTHGRLYRGVEEDEWGTVPSLRLFGGSPNMTGAARFVSSYAYPDTLAWRRWQVISQLSSPECEICGQARPIRNTGQSVMTSICPCTHPRGKIWLIGCWRCGFILAKVKLMSGAGGPWVFRMEGMGPPRRRPRLQDVPPNGLGGTATRRITAERAWQGAPHRIAEEGGAPRAWIEPVLTQAIPDAVIYNVPETFTLTNWNTATTTLVPPTLEDLGARYQHYIDVLRRTQETG